MTASNEKIPSSFRDPSGFLFSRDGLLYRQVNTGYKENYDLLMTSGLYQSLADSGLLVSHQEVGLDYAKTDQAYKILKPELIPFVSYPYEWCFSQLKDAALATLEIQKVALDFGMSLKDSSAYNIQFLKGKPVLIDTLSFEKYNEGQPWVAYKQFCQHFLAPLVLAGYRDIRLNQLLRVYMDGIPLDLTSSLLPFRTRFRFSLLTHIHLHAKSQKRFADKQVKVNNRKISRMSFLGLIDNLYSAVKRLKWNLGQTEWGDYYDKTNYSTDSFELKKQYVAEYIDKINPKVVWDLGANTGVFSRIASDKGIQTISFDVDPIAVEKNYLESVQKNEANILPLLLDLTNPSSGIGWEHRERTAFMERGPVDTVLALALIHHLAISNNLPIDRIAKFFHSICNSLIIEFIPKSDSQVQKLLATREDIFPDYTLQVFENSFNKFFAISASVKIKDTERFLYLLAGKEI
jgi:hypothetical protein